eukprot:TRINITY_DN79_c0_g1_i4.p1 TRINITY_DN79_c0_g1~~TRINITY_DN79_c0_g1_i4.p1  ORF type:complete len:723 (-),score=62.31 TRINITY_DN79_c0_g1_i4:549-2618(-)
MRQLFTLYAIFTLQRIALSQQLCNRLQWFHSNTIKSLQPQNFTNGPVFLTQPGYYQLTDNIEFNPNKVTNVQSAYYFGDVNWNQIGANETYDRYAFSLGFFAAIIITGNDIILDLNGYTLQQSEEHALQQRFFSNVELSDRPFIFGKGPHDFGKPMTSSQNVCIQNGILGRSSHSGIHGNNNYNVEIRDVTIQDFEVAGISLNNQTKLQISDVQIPRGREVIPVVGTWSAARNIREYINRLVDNGYEGQLQIGDRRLDAPQIQKELQYVMDQVFDLVINKQWWLETQRPQPSQVAMFLNPMNFSDSNMYGLVIHGAGPASAGFPDGSSLQENDYSKEIQIQNVGIGRLSAAPREIPALKNKEGKPAKDISGAVFQTSNTDYTLLPATMNSDKVYIGNALSNAQLIVAKAILEGFDFGELTTNRNSIDQQIIDWAQGGQSLQQSGLGYLCNGDAQFHATNGVIGLRLDSSKKVQIQNVRIDRLENRGGIGSTLCWDNQQYQLSNGRSNYKGYYPGYTGGVSRGFSIAASKDVNLTECYVNRTVSLAGSSFGYDVHAYSDNIRLNQCTVDRVAASTQYLISDFINNPTPVPEAYGFHIYQNDRTSSVYGCDLSLGRQALTSGKDNKAVAAELSDIDCVFVGCSLYQTTVLTNYRQELKKEDIDDLGDKRIPVIDCPRELPRSNQRLRRIIS